MFSPPMWAYVTAALAAGAIFVLRFSTLMPQYRTRFIVIPLAIAAVLFSGAAIRHASGTGPLLIFADSMIAMTSITFTHGDALRRAGVEQAAGRPVPQVPAKAAVPMVVLVFVLIVGEALLLR